MAESRKSPNIDALIKQVEAGSSWPTNGSLQYGRASPSSDDDATLAALFGGAQGGTLGAVSDAPSREEYDARLAVAEARTETRFVQLDAKIDRLSDVLVGPNGVLAELKAVKADNRNTRWTILVIFSGSVVGGLTALWATQANLLSAFQAALALHH